LSQDVSAIAQPFVLKVEAMNRITGPGATATATIGGTVPPSAFRDSGISATSNPKFAHQIGSTIVVQSQAVGSSAIYFYDTTLAVLLGGCGGGDVPSGCVSIGNITYAIFDTGLGNSRLLRFDRTVSYTTPTHTINYTTPTTDIVACGSDVWITQPSLGQLMKLNPATGVVANYVFVAVKYLASDGVKVYGSGTTTVSVVDNATLAVTSWPMASSYSVFDMVWSAGKLIISQDAVRAHNPATGALLRTLDTSNTDAILTATGNVLVIYRNPSMPSLVLQAANLAQTATVQDSALGVFALTESTLLVGFSSSQANIYTA
jgi:hypothetical protein